MLDGRLLAPAGSGSERHGGGWARRPSDMSVALGRADGRSLSLLLVVMQAVPLKKKVMQLHVDTSHVRRRRWRDDSVELHSTVPALGHWVSPCSDRRETLVLFIRGCAKCGRPTFLPARRICVDSRPNGKSTCTSSVEYYSTRLTFKIYHAKDFGKPKVG